MIREYQRQPFAIKIKAGLTTYIPEMTKSLRRLRVLQKDTAGAALLYSGDEMASVGKIKITLYAKTAMLLFDA